MSCSSEHYCTLLTPAAGIRCAASLLSQRLGMWPRQDQDPSCLITGSAPGQFFPVTMASISRAVPGCGDREQLPRVLDRPTDACVRRRPLLAPFQPLDNQTPTPLAAVTCMSSWNTRHHSATFSRDEPGARFPFPGTWDLTACQSESHASGGDMLAEALPNTISGPCV